MGGAEVGRQLAGLLKIRQSALQVILRRENSAEAVEGFRQVGLLAQNRLVDFSAFVEFASVINGVRQAYPKRQEFGT